MHITTHAKLRAQQRGIDPDLMPLVYEEGAYLWSNQDQLILRKQDIERLIKEGRRSKRLLQRAAKACPLVVVARETHILTIFRPTRRLNRRA